ncbi:c-type cytochrome [Saccharicrinis sp. FJH62]|uniref:c-type cytochrome n=1 Tax=Saccharicrinis sp. FJH62 TaxID=3344657 RepID=UPI0035D460C1
MKNYVKKHSYLVATLFSLFLIPVIDAQNTTGEATKTGEQVYRMNCLACHQANGSGVPNLAPPLKQTTFVLGDKTKLIDIVLKGFNEDVEIEGEYYSNPMPPFAHLSDEEIAKVLTYIRSNFGNKAEPVSSTEVKAVREKMKEGK